MLYSYLAFDKERSMNNVLSDEMIAELKERHGIEALDEETTNRLTSSLCVLIDILKPNGTTCDDESSFTIQCQTRFDNHNNISKLDMKFITNLHSHGVIDEYAMENDKITKSRRIGEHFANDFND